MLLIQLMILHIFHLPTAYIYAVLFNRNIEFIIAILFLLLFLFLIFHMKKLNPEKLNNFPKVIQQ